ncbi:exported hypothetical protein [Syntrophobacter sp. SbD1]|nr:exported hypothetical protein [Syntrophobacter sp. SbD1]
MKFSRLGAAILLLIAMNMVVCTGMLQPSAMVYAQERAVDDEIPPFENRLETDHFVLKWTNKSYHPRDDIKDPEIIKETAEYLEEAWAKYMDLFGRAPYTAPGKNKVEVIFRDIDCYGVADPPDGPIQFSSTAWVDKKTKGIRRPTSAHELFHKLQYAYGFKTKWRPPKPYKWFTEGTAAWSEVYVWGMVSRTEKIDELFKDTNMDFFYEAEDTAMPFWIYFVQGNQEHPNNQLMRKFFEACERLHDGHLALQEVVEETYGPIDRFLDDFAKARKTGFWGGPCDAPYKSILGPEGTDLVAEVKDLQRKLSGSRKATSFPFEIRNF